MKIGSAVMIHIDGEDDGDDDERHSVGEYGAYREI